MALSFNNAAGGAKKSSITSYSYRDGDNEVRLVGDVLARYVYWLEGKNGKNIPFECLSFDRNEERFNNMEKDWVREYYPDLKCGWSYAMQCLTGEVKSSISRRSSLKLFLLQQKTWAILQIPKLAGM